MSQVAQNTPAWLDQNPAQALEGYLKAAAAAFDRQTLGYFKVNGAEPTRKKLITDVRMMRAMYSPEQLEVMKDLSRCVRRGFELLENPEREPAPAPSNTEVLERESAEHPRKAFAHRLFVTKLTHRGEWVVNINDIAFRGEWRICMVDGRGKTRRAAMADFWAHWKRYAKQSLGGSIFLEFANEPMYSRE